MIYCTGNRGFVSLLLHKTKTGIAFSGANLFTAQLSNSSGSFSTPLAIGSVNATSAGSIKCVIPTSVTPGSNYRIRVTSSNVFDSSINNGRNITIGVIKPVKPIIGSNSPLCTGDTLKLSLAAPTSGASYTWLGPSFSSNLQTPNLPNAALSMTGQYTITVQLLGCFSRDTTTVTINQIPLPVVANSNSVICEPDTLKLTCTNSSPGANYSWVGPGSYTSTLQNSNRTSSTSTMSGDYIVTASLGTTCVQKDTVSVTVKPLPANRQINSNSPVCSGKILSVNASSTTTGSIYAWIGPSGFNSTSGTNLIPNVQTSSTGKYVVTYELNGCFVKDSISVLVNQSPLPVSASVNSPVCEPETIHLNCNDNLTGSMYLWSGPNGFNSTSQNPDRQNTQSIMSGNYVVTVSLPNGCKESDTIYALINPSPSSFSATGDLSVCINDTLFLNAANTAPNVKYTWLGPNNFSSTDSSTLVTEFNSKKSGKYTITAAIGDCKESAEINAELLDPKLELGENLVLCNGETKLIELDILYATYLWQDGNTENKYTISKEGVYKVEAQTQCGLLKDSIGITYQLCDCHPFVPSAFSPNGDGRNDKIGAIIDCQISSYKFVIVNRWGQTVFESNDPTAKWNGVYKGQNCDIGAYYYLLQIKGPLNKNYLFKGNIFIIN